MMTHANKPFDEISNDLDMQNRSFITEKSRECSRKGYQLFAETGAVYRIIQFPVKYLLYNNLTSSESIPGIKSSKHNKEC